MIIDQLPSTVSDNLTDEVPVEQGQLTFKTTWQKILNLFQTAMQSLFDAKQDELVSGTNIKTVGGSSLLGSGDVSFKTIGTNSVLGSGDISFKTVGGVSIFGSGDIPAGGGSALVTKTITGSDWSIDSGNNMSVGMSADWSGHTPIGVVGWQLENAPTDGARADFCTVVNCYVYYTGAQYRVGVKIHNAHTSSTAKVKFTATVLYTVD